MGPGYSIEDFRILALAGANYVHVSHPGLFTEKPPYVLDEKVQASLDRLLSKIASAGLYAVIAFRTGPGRNEAGFDENEKARADHSLWKDKKAQDAWVRMWAHTAARYRGRPEVIGYDLLVEPNANWALLKIDDPETFYARYRGTLYDWNPLAARLTVAVREADKETPVLVDAMNYGDPQWLPYVVPTGDNRTVYGVHHYYPYGYTHQDPAYPKSYPGTYEGEWVDKARLRANLDPVAAFRDRHGVPVAVTEFGVARWAKDGTRYLTDVLSVFEDLGLNHSIWQWEPLRDLGYNKFNLRYGTEAASRAAPRSENPWLRLLGTHWQLNTQRFNAAANP